MRIKSWIYESRTKVELGFFFHFKGEKLIGFTNKDAVNQNSEKNIQETKHQINESYPRKFMNIFSLLYDL